MGHQSSEGHLRYGGQGAEQPMWGDDTVVIRAHKVGGRGPLKCMGSQVSPVFWKMMKEYFSSSHLLCLGTKTPVGTVGTKT